MTDAPPAEPCPCPGVSRTGCPCPRCHGTGWYAVGRGNPDQWGVEDYDEVYCECPDGRRRKELVT